MQEPLTECTLCGIPVQYYRVVRGIKLCNPCAADFRPIKEREYQRGKKRVFSNR